LTPQNPQKRNGLKSHNPMPKKKLSTQHANFCLLMAGGNINQTHAYMECYPDSNYDSARADAPRLLAKASIQAEVQRLQKLTTTSKVMSMAEKREFLAEVKRTPIGEIDESSPLAQEKTVTISQYGQSTKIKMMSKKDAVDIDNKMAGHYEPDVVEYNSSCVCCPWPS